MAGVNAVSVGLGGIQRFQLVLTDDLAADKPPMHGQHEGQQAAREEGQLLPLTFTVVADAVEPQLHRLAALDVLACELVVG